MRSGTRCPGAPARALHTPRCPRAAPGRRAPPRPVVGPPPDAVYTQRRPGVPGGAPAAAVCVARSPVKRVRNGSGRPEQRPPRRLTTRRRRSRRSTSRHASLPQPPASPRSPFRPSEPGAERRTEVVDEEIAGRAPSPRPVLAVAAAAPAARARRSRRALVLLARRGEVDGAERRRRPCRRGHAAGRGGRASSRASCVRRATGRRASWSPRAPAPARSSTRASEVTLLVSRGPAQRQRARRGRQHARRRALAAGGGRPHGERPASLLRRAARAPSSRRIPAPASASTPGRRCGSTSPRAPAA